MSKVLRKTLEINQIDQLYKKCTDRKLKERILAIKLIYRGWKTKEVAEHLDVSQKTIYNWLNLWNEGELEALKPQKRGKRKQPYLSQEEWQEILAEIEDKGYNLQKLREYVKTTRGKEYSYKGVWNVVRRRLKIPYGKPYVLIGKQSQNAPAELKKN